MTKLYKLEKHNRIHKEGFEAGYKKASKEERERIINIIKDHDYLITGSRHNNMDNNNKYFTAEEIAEMLKVTTESVRRWIRDGKLKSVKLGGRYIRVSQKDLDEFIQSQRGDNNNG